MVPVEVREAPDQGHASEVAPPDDELTRVLPLLGEEPRQLGRIVLAVPVERDDRERAVADRPGKAGSERGPLALVRLLSQDGGPGGGRLDPRRIGGAVVDHEDRHVDPGLGDDPPDAETLIVGGDQGADLRLGVHVAMMRPRGGTESSNPAANPALPARDRCAPARRVHQQPSGGRRRAGRSGAAEELARVGPDVAEPAVLAARHVRRQRSRRAVARDAGSPVMTWWGRGGGEPSAVGGLWQTRQSVLWIPECPGAVFTRPSGAWQAVQSVQPARGWAMTGMTGVVMVPFTVVWQAAQSASGDIRTIIGTRVPRKVALGPSAVSEPLGVGELPPRPNRASSGTRPSSRTATPIAMASSTRRRAMRRRRTCTGAAFMERRPRAARSGPGPGRSSARSE